MKETESNKAGLQKTEIHAKKEVKKELKHFGSTRIRKGHILYEVKILNDFVVSIEPAKYESVTLDLTKTFEKGHKVGKAHKKVIMNPNCIYVSALNKENALKKIRKNK